MGGRGKISSFTPGPFSPLRVAKSTEISRPTTTTTTTTTIIIITIIIIIIIIPPTCHLFPVFFSSYGRTTLDSAVQ
jgi:hypothetical protein